MNGLPDMVSAFAQWDLSDDIYISEVCGVESHKNIRHSNRYFKACIRVHAFLSHTGVCEAGDLPVDFRISCILNREN